MAASVNRVFILGNLGQDPELRYTPNQMAVVTMNVATTDVRQDREGQRQETTEWHRVVVWNKQAENCAKYLSKGRTVFVEGRLQTRSWEDKTGVKRYTTEIVAQNVQFVGSPRDSAPRDISRPTQSEPPPGGPDFGSTSGIGGPETPGLDDVPF